MTETPPSDHVTQPDAVEPSGRRTWRSRADGAGDWVTRSRASTAIAAAALLLAGGLAGFGIAAAAATTRSPTAATTATAQGPDRARTTAGVAGRVPRRGATAEAAATTDGTRAKSWHGDSNPEPPDYKSGALPVAPCQRD